MTKLKAHDEAERLQIGDRVGCRDQADQQGKALAGRRVIGKGYVWIKRGLCPVRRIDEHA